MSADSVHASLLARYRAARALAERGREFRRAWGVELRDYVETTVAAYPPLACSAEEREAAWAASGEEERTQ